MSAHTPAFSVAVQGITGRCPAGEAYANEQIGKKTFPVLSCEGPCIRGEIARLAANLVASEMPELARSCHAEAFYVPHSAMRAWLEQAEKIIMMDGCFLKCHGRVLNNLVPAEKVIHFDVLPFHKKFMDGFLMEDYPEAERKAVARQVADKIIAKLKQEFLETTAGA